MANIVLLQKTRKWKKDYATIVNGKGSVFSDNENKAFYDILQWVAQAGYNNVDIPKLDELLGILNKENQDRMQSDFRGAVNSFTSILSGLANMYKTNKNTWYDFYDEVKDIVGKPSNNAVPEPIEELTNNQPQQPKVVMPERPEIKPMPSRPERKKEHFSWKALGELVLLYGGAILLGLIPFGLFSWAVSLIDSDHWVWGILMIILALGSISVAWYGWLAAAAIAIPIWICTTSWWWLGGLILLFEAYLVYSASFTTDD